MSKKTVEASIKERVIYIMLSPAEKKFYIGHCAKESVRETYRHNIKLRRQDSKAFVSEILPGRPCMFILEEINGTVAQATGLVLAWTKIFIERGYESYNRSGFIDLTDDLYEENQALYDSKKDADITSLTSCLSCAIPVYNHSTCEKYPQDTVVEEQATAKKKTAKESTSKRKREHLIHIRVSDEEYEMILLHAKRLKMQVGPYVRRAATAPKIIQHDYSAVTEHTKELGRIRNSINRLVFTIEATNNYLPRDIETIVELMKKVFKTENKLLKKIQSLW